MRRGIERYRGKREDREKAKSKRKRGEDSARFKSEGIR